MKIVLKTKNLKLNQAFQRYLNERLSSLEKFGKIFQTKKYFNDFYRKGKPRVEAWVEIGKETRHHQKGQIFFAECQIRFPGKTIRAVAQSEDLRKAITELKDELQRELKQYKEKLTSLTKRRQRSLKKSFHFSSQARFWRKGRIREE